MLAVIARIGISGGVGHVIEYAGSAIRALSMEGRLTVCNMSIEAGARAGMIAPDEKTFAYLEGREFAPKGAHWDQARGAVAHAAYRRGRALRSRGDARCGALVPMVSWGTTPEDSLPITGRVPDPGVGGRSGPAQAHGARHRVHAP